MTIEVSNSYELNWRWKLIILSVWKDKAALVKWLRSHWFSSTFRNAVSNYERVVGYIFYDTFLFLPLLFESLCFIVRLFLLKSFQKFRILNFDSFELFFSVNFIETLVHSFLLIIVYGMVPFDFLNFEFGLFAHDSIYFMQQHSVLPFNLSESILLQHVFFFIVDYWRYCCNFKRKIDICCQRTDIS